MRTPRRAAAAAAVLTLTLSVLAVLAPPSSADQNDPGPPGNNGTVKLDGLDLNDGPGHSNQPNDPDETEPDNDPHLDCALQLEFFNFDTGQMADITFTAHPPTGNNGVLLSEHRVISDDGTGGANNDPDLVIDYDVESQFDLEQFTDVHDVHGWHVKLNVELSNADGTPVPGGQKHKVFWVEPCGGEEAEVGGLTVDKAVSGNDLPPAGTTFGFTVACTLDDEPFDLNGEAAGTSVTFTLVAGTVESNDVETFSDIPEGAVCRVTETDDAGADSTSWLVGTTARPGELDGNNDEFVELTIRGDASVAVVATNVFNETVVTPETGSLSIDKLLDGDDAPVPGTQFTFVVECVDGSTPVDLNGDESGTTLTFSLTAAQAARVIADIPTGSECTVTETGDAGADSTSWMVDGIEVVQDGDSVDDLVIGEGTTVAVVATNTFDTQVGGVVIPRPPTPVTPPSVAPQQRPGPAVLGSVQTRNLPRTGGEALPLAALGIGLLVLGAGLTLTSRRYARV